jgi:hypothetical protein
VAFSKTEEERTSGEREFFEASRREVLVDTTGDRVFRAVVRSVPQVIQLCRPVRLREDPPLFALVPAGRLRKEPFVRVEIHPLKPRTRFLLDERSVGKRAERDANGCIRARGDEKSTQRISYSAEAPARQLRISTNQGSRKSLSVFIGGRTPAGETLPLPSRLDFCKDDGAACAAGFTDEANKGSLDIEADRHTLIRMFDCQAPINRPCSEATGFVRIQNFRVRRFLEAVHKKGTAAVDINLHTVPTQLRPDEQDPPPGDAVKLASGNIIIRRAGAGFLGFEGANIAFPFGFFAERRQAGFSFFGPDGKGLGHAECPDGVDFEVLINDGPDQQLKQEICEQ